MSKASEPVLAAAASVPGVGVLLELVESFGIYDFTERQWAALMAAAGLLAAWWARARVSPVG